LKGKKKTEAERKGGKAVVHPSERIKFRNFSPFSFVFGFLFKKKKIDGNVGNWEGDKFSKLQSVCDALVSYE
jgi:hypothetical protein